MKAIYCTGIGLMLVAGSVLDVKADTTWVNTERVVQVDRVSAPPEIVTVEREIPIKAARVIVPQYGYLSYYKPAVEPAVEPVGELTTVVLKKSTVARPVEIRVKTVLVPV